MKLEFGLKRKEKAFLLYLQNHDKISQTTLYPVQIANGLRIDYKEGLEIIDKLEAKKLLEKVPLKKEMRWNDGLVEKFEVKITFEGLLYQFPNKWTIIGSIGAILATISTIGGFTIAIFFYLQP